jgi:endogenous inhibitor of DNA gyrase (YacG/DUF329 family)
MAKKYAEKLPAGTLGRELGMEKYLLEFACAKCQKHIAWALPQATVICPACGRKVSQGNMKNANPARLPLEGGQLVLFADFSGK